MRNEPYINPDRPGGYLLVPPIKHRLWPLRKFLRSLDNWRRGFAFGYVRRCRACGHTAYYSDHCDA